jgi:hypothetical protein
MSPETALTATVQTSANYARQYPDDEAAAPWLVTSAVLATQQAVAIALRAAGDRVPAQAGATELVLRAATQDRLPAPFTLPMNTAARRVFEDLVDARNAFMHPRGLSWTLATDVLSKGLLVASQTIRHLILTQPVLQDLVAPDQQAVIGNGLQELETLAEFLDDSV